jgi:Bacterial PH domain
MSDAIAFRSKTDLWQLVLLLGVPAACVAGAAQYWPAVGTRYWWVGVMLAIGTAFPLWIVFSIRYFLSDTALRVRCGPFRWTIEIAEISKITPANSLATGPALSSDRVRIDYGQDQSIMISPEPRNEFIHQLEYRLGQAGG